MSVTMVHQVDDGLELMGKAVVAVGMGSPGSSQHPYGRNLSPKEPTDGHQWICENLKIMVKIPCDGLSQ